MSRMLKLALLLSMLCTTACAGARMGQAPKRPDGSPIAMQVHVDEGLAPDAPADKAKQVHQLSEFMEENLLKLLRKSGYAATLVEEPAAPSAPGSYALKVKIQSYDGGSKAARMLVGFGAGSAKLDTHFDLIGEGGAALVSGDPSSSSSSEWTYAAQETNILTIKAINEALKSK